MLRITIGLIFSLWSLNCLGQFIVKPLPNENPGTRKTNASRKQDIKLTLPFFDDFSESLDGLPNAKRWEFGSSTQVTSGTAIKSPGKMSLTLDGIDSVGAPYSEQPLLNGFRDKITSAAIDLSLVPLGKRNSVWMSFFYQWGGNAEIPDLSDYLQLEFLNADLQWVAVMKINPTESRRYDLFYDTIFQISDPGYYHDSFRFRFRTFGRLSGGYDAWNLDYIYIDEDRSITDMSWPDRALSGEPGPLFGRLRSIPRHHFILNPELTTQQFEIRNMKNVPAAVNFRTDVTFSNFNGTTAYPVYTKTLAKATPINITSNILFANEHKLIRTDTLPDPSDPLQFQPDADSIHLEFKIILNSNDNTPLNKIPPIEPDSTGDYIPRYEPINFRTNDTLIAAYDLSSYSAYDDGKAEYSATLTNAGNRAAVAFEVPDGLIDTLVGFDVYFPKSIDNLTADFSIYPDDEGVPGESIYTLFNRPAPYKGKDIFIRFNIEPLLVRNRFYIGWKAPVSGSLLVGLDNSNNTGDLIFVNTGGSWIQNTDLTGSLMIRPRFGSGDIVTSVEDNYADSGFYPNPGSGIFKLNAKGTVFAVKDLTGREVEFKSTQDSETTTLVLDLADGIYFATYRVGNNIRTSKLIILH